MIATDDDLRDAIQTAAYALAQALELAAGATKSRAERLAPVER